MEVCSVAAFRMHEDSTTHQQVPSQLLGGHVLGFETALVALTGRFFALKPRLLLFESPMAHLPSGAKCLEMNHLLSSV